MLTATPAPAAAPTSQLRFSTGARWRDHGEFYDEQKVLAASSQVLPEAPLPPGDWASDVTLMVDVTAAGNTAAVAMQADAPWSVISEVRFLDAAGNAVYALTGYALYLVNLLGGFYGKNDPGDSPYYSAPVTGTGATGGTFSFLLHLPLEIIQRDAIGAIPNGASNSVCRVAVVLAPNTAVYSTQPTNAPAVRIRMAESGYVVPAAASPLGNTYQVEPPGAGTFQQLTEMTYPFNSGRSMKDHTRKGNVYRSLIIVARDGTGARSDTVLTEFEFSVDDVRSAKGRWPYLRHRTCQRQSWAASKLPTGVIQVSYAHDWDGIVGGELRDSWVLTQPGTSVFFHLNASDAGNLQVITNEVVPRDGIIRA